jgi:hypothetical protein
MSISPNLVLKLVVKFYTLSFFIYDNASFSLLKPISFAVIGFRNTKFISYSTLVGLYYFIGTKDFLCIGQIPYPFIASICFLVP